MYGDHLTGFSHKQKITYGLKYLKQFKNNPEDIVIFVDSYDSLLQTNLDDIFKRFAMSCPQKHIVDDDNRNCRILFSAENVCNKKKIYLFVSLIFFFKKILI